MTITLKRKEIFCREWLANLSSPIGFADVGSGGKLKNPWRLIPAEKIKKIDFEPTQTTDSHSPFCISNRKGKGKFYIALNERASSLHEASPVFAERYSQQSNYTKQVIEVDLTTLDDFFGKQLSTVDLLDINVEGHDFQVLQGAPRLLKEGNLKLIKIEFELTEVWREQGWFSDIDSFLRARGYELANLDVHFKRPTKVSHIFHKGEPVWGKAFYVPDATLLNRHLALWGSSQQLRDEVMKAIVLYTLVEIPGRAFDLIDRVREINPSLLDGETLKKKIAWVFACSQLDNFAEKIVHKGRLLIEKVQNVLSLGKKSV